MCRTCGCDGGAGEHEPGGHGHGHGHGDEVRGSGDGNLGIDVPVSILGANDAAARRNRERFAGAGVLAINVVGSPGAGKTALIEATLDNLPPDVRAGVIVADLATDNDARRLRRPGVPVLALETGTRCHLSAIDLEHALARFPLAGLSVLFIENVGNLVCPALFDLGEAEKVALVSVTEGTDKPEKYPVMVRHASLLLLTKLDLLPYVDFDLDAAAYLARRVHPEIDVIAVTSRTREGVEPWLRWIETRLAAASAGAAGKRSS
jgi:hydrogenase nickel incorporation protein HypB